jgi:hypothetical protein
MRNLRRHAAALNLAVTMCFRAIVIQQLGDTLVEAVAMARPDSVQGNRPFFMGSVKAARWG